MGYGSVLAAMLSASVLLGMSFQEKAKSIKEVMNIAHKGKDSMLTKITDGKGTEDDNKKLLELYQIMAALKAPQGDEKSWKEKSEALVSAAKELVEKKEGAVAKLKTASNCKGCHSVHKPAK